MEDLVRCAKDGDKAAFEELVRLNQRGVYTLALRHTGNHDDALDISQEAFFRAYKGMPHFKGECAFSTWIYRLTVNACIDHLRRSKRKRASLFSEIEDGDRILEIPDTSRLPEDAAEFEELKAALSAALQTLPEKYRAVFILRAVNGLAYDEIAEILELEEGTVKSRLSRAREKLKDILARQGNIREEKASKGQRRKEGEGHE